MNRDRIAGILLSEKTGQKITAMGWVKTRRDSRGGFSFIELNDGSCLKNLQIIADSTLFNYEREILKLQPGCAIQAKGTLTRSSGKGQSVELHADKIEVLGWADPDFYPLQKKRHSFEFLRTIAHLRPRSNTLGAVMRIRNAMSMAIHRFFQEKDFLYIHTPIITGSDCEGAGEMFRVTSFDIDNIPKTQGRTDFEKDFFSSPAHLTVSGQLEAEACALSMCNVYTFGPTFRAENSNTSRHLAEFWMVEPEMAFCDLEDDISIAIDFLKYIITYILKNCEDDMQFFNHFIDKTIIETLERITSETFEVLTYTEGMEILTKASQKFDFPVKWGNDLQSEHERYLCEKVFNRPVVLKDYPREIKAFYMKANSDGKTVRAMDVLFPKIGEIIGGSQREDDYETLVNRIKELGLNPENYWWYLDLRKFGSAPHSGFGLGFERLIQFATGMANIRDVIPFPRTPGNISF